MFIFKLQRYRTKVEELLPLGLLMLLLFGQAILLWQAPLSPKLVGDEGYYVSKAEYLVSHGAFPQETKIEKRIREGEQFGYSDCRPPGYPAILALLAIDKPTVLELRKRISIVQFTLSACVLLLLYIGVWVSIGKSSFLYVVAVIIGIQPWTFEYVNSFLTEQLTMSFFSIGLAGLCIFIASSNKKICILVLLLSAILLSTAFMLRPEMIVFVPLLCFLAIIFRHPSFTN